MNRIIRAGACLRPAAHAVLVLLLVAAPAEPARGAAVPAAQPAVLPTAQAVVLPIEVSGAAYAEFDPRTGVWIFRGAPVVITRGAIRLEARQIRYAERSGIAMASGGVVVRHEAITLRAAEAEGRLREQFVSAREVALTERRPEGEVRLTAARVEAFLADRRVEATGHAELTLRDAILRGDRLSYDWGGQHAVVTGAAELLMPEGRLSAERITAALAAETVEAAGAVRLTSQDVVATAPRARLDRKGGSALLSGGVLVRRGPDTLSAETVTFDLRTRRLVATGSPRLLIGEGSGN